MMTLPTTIFFTALLFFATPLYAANDMVETSIKDAVTEKSYVRNGSLRGNSNRPHGRTLWTEETWFECSQEEKREGATCDCNYGNTSWNKLFGGGCAVSQVPKDKHGDDLPQAACRCFMSQHQPYTCGGEVRMCGYLDRNKPKCIQPDTSREACTLGGGDCGGY